MIEYKREFYKKMDFNQNSDVKIALFPNGKTLLNIQRSKITDI